MHFPFCERLCPYCDFAVRVSQDPPHDSYADGVLAELAARAPRYAGRTLETIYLGGGTPGMWRPDAVARVLGAVARSFPRGARALEITCEVNPEGASPAALAGLRAAGVNRLSLGVQALAPRALAQLGRAHDPARATSAMAWARAAGFDDISLDLIYALPGAPAGELAATLAGVVALAPEHVSAYALTIEERTRFGALARRGALQPPEADAVADDFELTHATLTSAGFEHYEVSSFARLGRRSRHNASYWSGAEYLGLGVSAHSLRRLPDGRLERFASPRALQAWSRGVAALSAAPAPADPVAAPLEADALAELHELLGPRDAAFERVFLGLRTSDGVAEADLVGHTAALPDLVAAGLITRENGRVCPTPRGMLLGDALALKLG
ncbi:MAG: radical SAM family heme chaperone HemW [Deltaproteobacteria bacterium]|nr:radical SAM family heme chaperone HemW [Deltaproteobacteria bacterium]